MQDLSTVIHADYTAVSQMVQIIRFPHGNMSWITQIMQIGDLSALNDLAHRGRIEGLSLVYAFVLEHLGTLLVILSQVCNVKMLASPRDPLVSPPAFGPERRERSVYAFMM